MRLINTQTLVLEEFPKCPAGEYAILSHRWTDDETSYKDFLKGRRKGSTGYRKVLRLCIKARSRGLKYAWIDTCCIDKKSSAESSEAINSMYSWYASAYECYAYLSDVPSHSQRPQDNIYDPDLDLGPQDEGQQHETHGRYCTILHTEYKWKQKCKVEHMRSSEWFSRAWTLQELLAPSLVWFLDSAWEVLGFVERPVAARGLRMTTLQDVDLTELVSAITGISKYVLKGQKSMTKTCLAQKFSWLAKRKATRDEDLAYSMLGIAGVNMPLLYGEGMAAWYRLQETIIASSTDQSIFAWDASFWPESGRGVLCPHPKGFASCSDFCRMIPAPGTSTIRPYSLTNQGLELDARSLGIWRTHKAKSEMLYLSLNCSEQYLFMIRAPCGHFDVVRNSKWQPTDRQVRQYEQQQERASFKSRLDGGNVYVHATKAASDACANGWTP